MKTRTYIFCASLPILALACGSDPANGEATSSNTTESEESDITEMEGASEESATAALPSDPDDGATTATESSTEAQPEPAAALEDGPGEFTLDFATSEDFFTLMDGPRDGLASSPHGVVQIYYSTNIESVIDDASFEAPPGTVSIKTQDTDDDGAFDVLMVMIKQAEGTNPDTDDWLYQTRSPSGDVMGENAAFCSDCHKAWPQTDSLGGTTLRD